MSQSNFNLIAPVYDFLAKMVFGSHLKKAQTIFLNQIKEGDRVLVVGGGTGWILEELNQLNKPIKVVYVEPSTKMMSLSKARLTVEVTYPLNIFNNLYSKLYPINNLMWYVLFSS